MDTDTTPEPAKGTIVALSHDLFFGMRIRTVIRQLGYGLELINDEAALIQALETTPPILVFVDFNKPVDWDALAPLLASETPVVGFSSHTNVDGFRAAKAAGIDRTVSNGQFSRSMPELIEQYART